ncbi:MAG: 50S ribosomal protein L6 [Desulfomicrobium sp.]|jgi:large subunit ribosomal protein L6|nr:50S ribosomal protein L6 [Desulfomicrobium sp.]NLV97898.1 50S ribosomal protein L6 [Desulfovibrionales bacterium]
MSRVGKVPITIPAGVDVQVGETVIVVKGPKGTLNVATHPAVAINLDSGTLTVSPVDESRIAHQQYGLRRTLIANAVMGVDKGYQKTLEVVGVGYRVNVQGKTVVLNVGYSHPVNYPLPTGVDASVEGNKIHITGFDKQLIGEVAAQIRRVRPPEPYKGKGIKYIDEIILRKAGKSGGSKK